MVVRFLIFSVILFAVIYHPWRMVAPTYKASLAKGSTLMLQFFAFDGDNKRISYQEAQGEFLIRHPMVEVGFGGESIHYNMMILAAMILASPGLLWRRKLRSLLIGSVSLYILHCFQLAIRVESIFSHKMKHYSLANYSDFERQTFETISQFLTCFGQQVLPFALWAILCVPAILKALDIRLFPQAPPPRGNKMRKSGN